MPRFANNAPLEENVVFDKLNDDCLRVLLANEFNTHKLLDLRRVGTRWRNVVDFILRTKHSMKLFPRFGALYQYIKDLLEYDIYDDSYYHLNFDDPDELVGRMVMQFGQREEAEQPPAPEAAAQAEAVPGPSGNGQRQVPAFSEQTIRAQLIAAHLPLAQITSESYFQALVNIRNRARVRNKFFAREVPGRETCNHYGRLFPNLNKLIVAACNEPNIDLHHLLEQWLALVELTIFDPPRDVANLAWCESIGRMNNLLRLELFDVQLTSMEMVQQLTPALKRLTHFTLGRCMAPQEGPDYVTAVLSALSPATLRTLSFHQVAYTTRKFREFLQNNSELARNLTHLTANFGPLVEGQENGVAYEITLGTIEAIVRYCTELQYLRFSHMNQFPTSRILAQLANLPSLTELSMYLQADHQDVSTLAMNGPIQPLTSIRKLKLNIENFPHQDYFIQLRRFFPNLTDFSVFLVNTYVPDDAQALPPFFPNLAEYRIFSLHDATDTALFGTAYQRQIIDLNLANPTTFKSIPQHLRDRRQLIATRIMNTPPIVVEALMDLREATRRTINNAMNNIAADVNRLLNRVLNRVNDQVLDQLHQQFNQANDGDAVRQILNPPGAMIHGNNAAVAHRLHGLNEDIIMARIQNATAHAFAPRLLNPAVDMARNGPAAPPQLNFPTIDAPRRDVQNMLRRCLEHTSQQANGMLRPASQAVSIPNAPQPDPWNAPSTSAGNVHNQQHLRPFMQMVPQNSNPSPPAAVQWAPLAHRPNAPTLGNVPYLSPFGQFVHISPPPVNQALIHIGPSEDSIQARTEAFRNALTSEPMNQMVQVVPLSPNAPNAFQILSRETLSNGPTINITSNNLPPWIPRTAYAPPSLLVAQAQQPNNINLLPFIVNENGTEAQPVQLIPGAQSANGQRQPDSAPENGMGRSGQ